MQDIKCSRYKQASCIQDIKRISSYVKEIPFKLCLLTPVCWPPANLSLLAVMNQEGDEEVEHNMPRGGLVSYELQQGECITL